MAVVFEHEKLDVYRVATKFADVTAGICETIEPGNAATRDQLRRSADSVINNIAEGAGEFAGKEKARFYRIALRSATESAALLHTCLRRGLADAGQVEEARVLLKQVVEMLTRLALAVARRSS